jgi:hypothetical protein
MPGRGAARHWRDQGIAPLRGVGVRVWGGGGAEWPQAVRSGGGEWKGREAKLRACTGASPFGCLVFNGGRGKASISCLFGLGS